MRFLVYGLLVTACVAAMKLFPDYRFILNVALVGIVAVILIGARRRGLARPIQDWSFLRSRKSKVGLALIVVSMVALLAGVLRTSVTREGAPPWLMLLLLPAVPLFLIGCGLMIRELIRATPHDELWGPPPWKRRS